MQTQSKSLFELDLELWDKESTYKKVDIWHGRDKESCLNPRHRGRLLKEGHSSPSPPWTGGKPSTTQTQRKVQCLLAKAGRVPVSCHLAESSPVLGILHVSYVAHQRQPLSSSFRISPSFLISTLETTPSIVFFQKSNYSHSFQELIKPTPPCSICTDPTAELNSYRAPDFSTPDTTMEVPSRPCTSSCSSNTCQNKNKGLIYQSP